MVQSRRERHVGLADRQEFCTPELLTKISQKMHAAPGDFLLFVADTFETSCKALNVLRKRLGEELKLYDPATMNFSWIVEFPMFAWDDEEKCWAAMHHPFTAPRPQDAALLATEPGKCRAQAYDLVINGSEAGGGTIRIHDQAQQQQVFTLLGIDQQKARERFGFLLDALQFGAPPHGGIALGHRPLGNAVRRPDEHPRLHRLPKNSEGDRLDDRRPQRRRCKADQGTWHFDRQIILSAKKPRMAFVGIANCCPTMPLCDYQSRLDWRLSAGHLECGRHQDHDDRHQHGC